MEHPVHDYFYTKHVAQFTFLQIPEILVESPRYRSLSNDAKILYGVLLKRMSLSKKNDWADEEGRIYIIYSVEDIQTKLNMSKPTAIKSLKALEDFNLIEKVRRGQGKPSIIYVKNFVTEDDFLECLDTNTDEVDTVNTVENQIIKDPVENQFHSENVQESCVTSRSKNSLLLEVKKLDFKKSKKFTSRSQKNEPLEVKEIDPNYIDIDRDIELYKSITPSGSGGDIQGQNERVISDTKMSRETMSRSIKEQIDYDCLILHYPMDVAIIDDIVELMTDVQLGENQTVRINGELMDATLVQSKFNTLGSTEIGIVITELKKVTSKITNIRGYLLSCLYNAKIGGLYYHNWVQSDMYKQARQIGLDISKLIVQ